MGLFSKREPCPFCGGKVKGLFVNKIEGRHICYDCYGVADLPAGAAGKMSLSEFNAYRAFRAENAQLKHRFNITQTVDFGWFDSKFVFDAENRLLCMSKDLDRTIFEGRHIKSFVIKEDSMPVFEGSAAGLIRHPSTVPGRLQLMMPQIQMFRLQMDRQRANNSDDDIRFDIPEPFKSFNVEIRFDHPYWDVFVADKSGPSFNNSYPDGNDYLRDYNADFATMEQLALALKQVAFPDTPEQTAQGGGVAVTAAAPNASVDAVSEIKRYKDLLEQGAITEEEFTAKKKQLLGI